MRQHTDVVVVGGGIVGASVAYFLRKAGVEVTLVEQGDAASGATGRNGGGYRQSARALPEMPLAVAGVEMSPGLWEELDENVEYVRSGNLRLAESEQELQAMAASVQRQQQAGLKTVRLVDRQEALDIVPALARDRVYGGTFCSTDGHLNPMLACLALVNGARRLGAEILTHTTVTGIEVEKGRLRAVRTTAGRIVTPLVVNAAGAGSIAVAAMAGLSMPARVRRLQAMVTERIPPLFAVMFGVASASLYWRQTVAGNILFGGRGYGPPDESTDCATVRWPVIGPVAAHLIQLVPALREVSLLRVWTGVDAFTLDDLPMIGPAPDLDGFVYASGYSGHGIPLGPITGLLLTELITTGKSSLPLSGLEPDRFAREAATSPPRRDQELIA